MNNGLYSSQGNNTNTAVIYEGVFRETAVDYYNQSQDNTIEIDYDTIVNSNYNRIGNIITVNSSGYYRIYAQCHMFTGTNGGGSVAIFINNAVYRSAYINDFKGTVHTYNISCITNLNANDNVSLHISAGTNLQLINTSSEYAGSLESYITIEKL